MSDPVGVKSDPVAFFMALDPEKHNPSSVVNLVEYCKLFPVTKNRLPEQVSASFLTKPPTRSFFSYALQRDVPTSCISPLGGILKEKMKGLLHLIANNTSDQTKFGAVYTAYKTQLAENASRLWEAGNYAVFIKIVDMAYPDVHGGIGTITEYWDTPIFLEDYLKPRVFINGPKKNIHLQPTK